MKCLGLDLSTTTCGYAITENKQIIVAGYIDISKVSTYQEKADLIIKTLVGQTFDKIVIEESLFGFARGGALVFQEYSRMGFILFDSFSAHKSLQHFRYRDAAICLLVVLNDGNHYPGQG